MIIVIAYICCQTAIVEKSFTFLFQENLHKEFATVFNFRAFQMLFPTNVHIYVHSRVGALQCLTTWALVRMPHSLTVGRMVYHC